MRACRARKGCRSLGILDANPVCFQDDYITLDNVCNESSDANRSIVGIIPAVMSGLEITAAVAGIIGCFANATTAFMEWRKQKKKKNTQKPDINKTNTTDEVQAKVRGSLNVGRRDIQKEYDRGVAELGRAFEQGDEIGISQLKDQIIKLQTNVITILSGLVTNSTGVPDTIVRERLQGLFAASEQTRHDSIGILKDQYQRLCSRQSLRPGPSPSRQASNEDEENNISTRVYKGDDIESIIDNHGRGVDNDTYNIDTCDFAYELTRHRNLRVPSASKTI
ncbi:hypothetical protein VTJ04DRAFT_9536 [Mycothermus thermophilus]|uniref:uncharacterized protein n=1 Tax=Humicola insolens TaxID=85995 RepID=UPI003742C68C